MSYAGQHKLTRPPRNRRIICNYRLPAYVIEGLFHRCQIAGLIIENGNHISPLVLGSILARRRSRQQAKRKARANALNRASSLW